MLIHALAAGGRRFAMRSLMASCSYTVATGHGSKQSVRDLAQPTNAADRPIALLRGAIARPLIGIALGIFAEPLATK